MVNIINLVRYRIYFNNLEEVHGFIERNDYIYRLKLPSGIIDALKHMRSGELSKVILQPKHGCILD
jgi:hypothetical protein